MAITLEMDGSRHAIVSHNLTAPLVISLDPTKGYMFFTDTDNIDRALMDGTQRKTIVSNYIYKASGLTLDYVNERVLWCDSQLDQIVSVGYDGQNRHAIIRGSTKVPAPVRLTIFENHVFWTDSTRQGVLKTNIYNSSDANVEAIYRERRLIKEPRAIKSYHSLRQPIVPNPCGSNNGGCHHMCVITRNGDGEAYALAYRCACNIGFQLASNQKSCVRIEEFLMYSQQNLSEEYYSTNNRPVLMMQSFLWSVGLPVLLDLTLTPEIIIYSIRVSYSMLSIRSKSMAPARKMSWPHRMKGLKF